MKFIKKNKNKRYSNTNNVIEYIRTENNFFFYFLIVMLKYSRISFGGIQIIACYSIHKLI